jgi:spore coat protein H
VTTAFTLPLRTKAAHWLWTIPALLLHAQPPTQAASENPTDLFEGRVVPRLQIDVPPEGMAVLKDYRQVWGKPRPERKDVHVTVQAGNTLLTNVALHLKGSFTFQPIDGKPSLTLNFDKFVRGQRFYGLDKIHLNNSVQDPSFLCEKLAREAFAEAGVPATRIAHARVILNGRDLGLYVLVEAYNKHFLKQHFESTKGNLYDGGSGGDISKALEVDSGDNPTDRSDLIALLAATRLTNPTQRLARLEQLLDVDRFLTFTALEVLFQHWDGYCLGPNNYRLFHDYPQDKLVFMPHGLDQILGVGQSPAPTITPHWDGLVAKALFTTAAGRRRYLERLQNIFTNQFQAERLIGKVDQMSERLHAAAGNVVARSQFDTAVQNLKARITRRVAQVARQLEHPERPLTFDQDGYARLPTWQFHGGRSPMASNRTKVDDHDTLEIRAGDSWSSASWRTLVLLPAGHYQLLGQGRTLGIPASATNSGVMLRISGERSPSGLTTNTDWTPLRYDFDVQDLINVELVCEFRGADGRGVFDAGSLRLRRSGSAKPVSEPR